MRRGQRKWKEEVDWGRAGRWAHAANKDEKEHMKYLRVNLTNNGKELY